MRKRIRLLKLLRRQKKLKRRRLLDMMAEEEQAEEEHEKSTLGSAKGMAASLGLQADVAVGVATGGGAKQPTAGQAGGGGSDGAERCEICGKLVDSHTDSQLDACIAMDKGSGASVGANANEADDEREGKAKARARALENRRKQAELEEEKGGLAKPKKSRKVVEIGSGLIEGYTAMKTVLTDDHFVAQLHEETEEEKEADKKAMTDFAQMQKQVAQQQMGQQMQQQMGL